MSNASPPRPRPTRFAAAHGLDRKLRSPVGRQMFLNHIVHNRPQLAV